MNQPSVSDIVLFGENAWLARFENAADPVALALYVNAVAAELRKAAGFLDVIAGLDSVTARFSPHRLNADNARRALETAISSTKPEKAESPGKRIVIPVCYGGAFGPDAADICALNKISMDNLTRLHAGQTYRVLTIGFAPGFAYMGPLDQKLQTPRLATPRAHLAAGSVGVANAFTGVYSLPSPGGWRIIGRTPLRLFDPTGDEPFVFQPGDEVVFTPISEDDFTSTEAAER